jgi:hypothetical protein
MPDGLQKWQHAMSGFAIYINWEYFLGVVGTLIAIAYYTNGRLTRLETSMEWVKDTLRRLTLNFQGTDSVASQPRSRSKKRTTSN